MLVGQNDGEDITAYKSPSKPSNSSDESSPQRLVYALFEQPFKNITTDSLDNNSIEKDLKQFVKDNNLVLVNAAYIYTQSPESADIVQRLQRITISFKEDGLLDSLVNTIDHLLGEVEDLLGIHLGLGSSPPKKPKQPKKPASKNEEGFNDDDADFEQNSMNIEERKANILHRVQRITDTFEVNGLLNSVLDIVKQLVGEIEDLLGVGAGTGRNNKGVKKNDDGDLLVGLSEEPVQELARDEMTLDNQRAVMTERLQRIAQVVNRAGLLQPVLDLVNNLLGEVEGILGIGPGRRRGKNNNGNDDREEGSRGLLGNLLGGLLGGLNEEEPVEAIQAAAVVTNNSEETAATVQDQSSMTVERLQRIAAAANEVGLLDPVLDVVRSLLDEIEAALGLNLDMGSGKNEIDEGSLLDVEHPYSGIGQDSEVIENHPRNFRRHARF